MLVPFISAAEETSQKSSPEQESHEDEAPKADSVWGAMRYTGYHIQKGSVTVGHGIKEGSITAGHGVKDGSVKAGKTMEKGLKKTGHEIKGFFVGDDD
jgi:hypothetical protein